MDTEELNRLANQHPDIVSMRKSRTIFSVIWFVASVVLLFINPLMGIIGLCTFPFLLLCLWFALMGKKRVIRKHIEKYGVDGVNPQNDALIRSGKRTGSNPVVDAAASYAIGKAVTSKIKRSPLATNPYNKKQTHTPTTARASSPRYVSKLGKSHLCCGTCEYWGGSRELDAVNHGRIANIITKVGKCSCKDSPQCRKNMDYDKKCGKWEKWSDLK